MPIREYEVRYCSEMPHFGRRYYWDRDEEKWTVRLYEARLQVTPATLIADLSTPNGVQLLWQHYDYEKWNFPTAVGRARTMEFDGPELVGIAAFDEANVMANVPGGFASLDAGINAGLSVGLQFLDQPPVTWEMREGTREDPDRLTYGACRITEVSLTPMPRIGNAGLMGRVGGDDPDAAADEGKDLEDA